MSLSLGKSFDREYKLRIPFLENYYNIGIFFNKKSPFVLFSVDSKFKTNQKQVSSVKVNMFKNLVSSKFCETFLDLHNYKSSNLDILHQFHAIKPEYHADVNFILNETINLSKIDVGDRTLYETLTIYGLSLTSYISEFVFLIAERQNIITKLNKKVVRTTGVQLATTSSLNLLDEFVDEARRYKGKQYNINCNPEEVIKIDEDDRIIK